MFRRALSRFFRFATARETLLVLGVGLAAMTGMMLVEQCRYVWHYTDAPEALHDAEGIVDGLAGVLVAGGVFLEGRETLRKLGGASEDTVEVRLSEVASQNGMGILIVGLFMEIGTLLIGLPPRVLNARGATRAIFGGCALLSLVTLVVLYDFVKDYLLTYRTPRLPLARD